MQEKIFELAVLGFVLDMVCVLAWPIVLVRVSVGFCPDFEWNGGSFVISCVSYKWVWVNKVVCLRVRVLYVLFDGWYLRYFV